MTRETIFSARVEGGFTRRERYSWAEEYDLALTVRRDPDGSVVIRQDVVETGRAKFVLKLSEAEARAVFEELGRSLASPAALGDV